MIEKVIESNIYLKKLNSFKSSSDLNSNDSLLLKTTWPIFNLLSFSKKLFFFCKKNCKLKIA